MGKSLEIIVSQTGYVHGGHCKSDWVGPWRFPKHCRELLVRWWRSCHPTNSVTALL